MSEPQHSGGAAMAGGQRFQARVTAWWCARVLLQTPMGELFGFKAESVPQRIFSETNDDVDDLRVEFDASEVLFGQCKRSLSLSSSVDSEWGSVVKQFYREQQNISPGIGYCLILFYEKNNRRLKMLEQILRRYRQSPQGSNIIDAAKNQQEQEIVNELLTLTQSVACAPNGDQSISVQQLLKRIYIKQLQLEQSDSDSLAIIDALQNGLLSNPSQLTSVLRLLHCLADDLLAERGSIDRIALRNRLISEGVALRESVNYKKDFERLYDLTNIEVIDQTEKGRTSLSIANDKLHISRPVLKEIVRAVQEASYIITGGAGSGKTGCLLTLVEELKSTGFRVWYWAADSLPYSSPQELQTHLNLQNFWSGIFSEAVSTSQTVLIIDGLDGLRDPAIQNGYRKLIALAKRVGIRVVASIRMFDLRYASDLQGLFPASLENSVSTQFISPDLKTVNHIVVPDLTEGEFNEVLAELPTAKEVLERNPNLQPILYNLFNLDLLCKLISAGDSAIQFSALSTQAELFEEYWNRRIEAQPLRQEMTVAIKETVEKMVEQKTLQTTPDNLSANVSNALFSSDFIRHPVFLPGRLPDEQLVEFNHHLLFDYVAERLFVRPRHKNLESELAIPNTWALFLRPSLLLYHRFAWTHGRDDFWETILTLEKSSVSLLNKYPSYIVVAEEAKNRQDLQTLLEGVVKNDADSPKWIGVINQVISAASFTSLPVLFDKSSGDWWIEFAKDLVSSANLELVFSGRRLLFSAFDKIENLSAIGKLLTNQSAIILIDFHWAHDKKPSRLISAPILWVCTTIASNLAESKKMIQKILSRPELERAGYLQAYGIANGIKYIWRVDPNLAVDVYDNIFGYSETGNEQIPMGFGQILPLLTNKRQDYEMVWYQLSQEYAEFLSAAPQEATRALIKTLNHYLYQHHLYKAAYPVKEFLWEGSACHIQLDYSGFWDNSNAGDPQEIMLQNWQQYLEKLSLNESNENWEKIKQVLIKENTIGAIWRKMLIAAGNSPKFFAQRIWTILLDSSFMVSLPMSVVEDCIKAFVPHLSIESVYQIEKSVLSIPNQAHNCTGKGERLLAITARLLQFIPEEKLTPAAKDFLSKNPPVSKEEQYGKVTTGVQEFTKEMWLQSQGLDITNPVIQELIETSSFLEQLTTKTITESDVSVILQKMSEIEQKLADKPNAAGDAIGSLVQCRLIHGYAQLACSPFRLDNLLIDNLTARFRAIIFDKCYFVPAQTAKWTQFREAELLNSKRDAVGALVCLAGKVDSLTDEYKSLLCTLARQPEKEVRMQVSMRLWSIFKKWPAYVWETLEFWIDTLPSEPQNDEVLMIALIQNWFWVLQKNDSMRATQLMKKLLNAVHSSNSRDLRKICGSWLGAIAFGDGETWASKILQELIQSLDENLDELQGASDFATGELLPRAIKVNLIGHQEAMIFLLNLIGAAKDWAEIHQKEISSQPTSEVQQILKDLHWLLYRITIEFRVSAENYATHWSSMVSSEATTQVSDWWKNAEPILEVLLAFPDPQIAYSLVDGIEHIIWFDVARGLHWLNKVTTASTPFGISGEQLAADKTINILGRVLAEHKIVLGMDESRLDFVQILEAYLQIGWPKAINLAIQLESIFR